MNATEQKSAGQFRLAPAGNTGKWWLLNCNEDIVAEFPPTTSEAERELICRGANLNDALIGALKGARAYVLRIADGDFSPGDSAIAKTELADIDEVIKIAKGPQ